MCERETKQAEISAFLLDRYGLVLGYEALSKVLGYASTDALERSVQRGYLTLKLVRMPGRRGVFALAPDVAEFLVETFNREGGAQPAERSERKVDEPKN